VAIQDVFSADEAQNKAMKIERLQNRALSFKGALEKTSGGSRTQQASISSEQPPAHKAIDAPPVNPTTAAAPTTKAKENAYAKLGVSKCYRYGKP